MKRNGIDLILFPRKKKKKKELAKLTDWLETEINYFKSDANDRFARRNK